jgi:hypothetical protein
MVSIERSRSEAGRDLSLELSLSSRLLYLDVRSVASLQVTNADLSLKCNSDEFTCVNPDSFPATRRVIT